MNIQILKTIEGAKEAEGLAVIIDVFRAFSLECYLFAAGARRIYPVGDMEEANSIAAAHPDCILVGEEGDAKAEGFSYGDSPWQTGAGQAAGRSYDGKPDIFPADNILEGIAVGPKGPFFPRKHKGFDGTPGCAAVPGLFSGKDFMHLTGTGSSGILAADRCFCRLQTGFYHPCSGRSMALDPVSWNRKHRDWMLSVLFPFIKTPCADCGCLWVYRASVCCSIRGIAA